MYTHIPVLLNEVIRFLKCEPGKIYVDCTLGLGGHAKEILKRIGYPGKLIGIDCDREAISKARRDLIKYKGNIIFVRDNFSNLKNILKAKKIPGIDGVLFDLGISSFQIENTIRGFSFKKDAYLDMRMDKRSSLTAKDIVNNFSKEQIETIIYKYGEEKYAFLIAENIVKNRRDKPILTTRQLVTIINQAIPHRAFSKIHFATRTFQSLRIAVNNELENLEQGLTQAIELLKKGGRIVVISFHSLEDRIVKNKFKKFSGLCTCPRLMPVCVCGKKKLINILTTKPVLPNHAEIQTNPKARSAKLRAAEKI